MKQISHYFPFFIVTILLYSGFFQFHKKSTIIPSIPLNSGQQAIQLEFIENAETPFVETTPDEPENTEEMVKDPLEITETTEQPIAEQSITKPPAKTPSIAKQPIKEASIKESVTTKQPKIVIYSKNNAAIKIAKQKLQKSIKETTAINDASLKAELFTKELQRPVEPVTKLVKKTIKPSTSTTTEETATTAIVPQIKIIRPAEITKKTTTSQQKKTKVIFKKQPSTSSNVETQGVLQEAIVVSGNKPVYPKTAILRNQQGRVVVELTITTKGKAKNPQIITSSGYSILDNAILDFIQKELFMPAHKGDEKITTKQVFSFRFELN